MFNIKLFPILIYSNDATEGDVFVIQSLVTVLSKGGKLRLLCVNVHNKLLIEFKSEWCTELT